MRLIFHFWHTHAHARQSVISAISSDCFRSCTVYCVGSCDAPLPAGVIRLEQADALPMRTILGGQQDGVVARWEQDRVLLANSDEEEKVLSLSGSNLSATELFSGEELPVTAQNDTSTFTIPPYGVVLATLNN